MVSDSIILFFVFFGFRSGMHRGLTAPHVAGAALTALEGFPLHTLFTSVFRPSQARGEGQHTYELMRHWKARKKSTARLVTALEEQHC